MRRFPMKIHRTESNCAIHNIANSIGQPNYSAIPIDKRELNGLAYFGDKLFLHATASINNKLLLPLLRLPQQYNLIGFFSHLCLYLSLPLSHSALSLAIIFFFCSPSLFFLSLRLFASHSVPSIIRSPMKDHFVLFAHMH